MAWTVLLLITCWATSMCCGYQSSSFYADNHLGQSVPIGKMPEKQQKDVQQDLLELMGLYSKPKPKTSSKILQSAAKFMRNVYDSLKGLDDPDGPSTEDSHIHINGLVNASALGLDPAKLDGSDVIVSFVNYARKISHLRHEKDRTFYFDFSKVHVGEQIRGAELRLYKERSDRLELRGRNFTLNLYAIKQGRDWEDKHLELESSLSLTGDKDGWVIMDATSIAENWTFFPHLNMGLYLKVVDSNGKEYHPSDVGIVGRSGSADQQPFLVGYMDVSPQVLERRSRSIRMRRWVQAEDVSYADSSYYDITRKAYINKGNCEKKYLYINFRDIGLGNEFLIAPEGYSAFFCSGTCSFPLGIHMNATNHAIVQTLVHLMEPGTVPEPCCAPTKFGPITLLYYDNNLSVILQRFSNMIVQSCGCL